MFQRVALFIAVATVIQSVNGYQNPVLNTTGTGFFKGSSVLKHNNVYYLITTDSYYKSIQMRTSVDLQTWSKSTNIIGRDEALDWMIYGNGNIYITSELNFINGQFVLYIATVTSCIGVATAKNIEGPYEVQPKPLLCGIDGRKEEFEYPTVLIDNSSIFLYYNHYNDKRMAMEVRPLSADGLSLADPNDVTVVLEPTEAWEGKKLFAPNVVKYLDLYYLLYEAECNGLYASRSLSPKGPFQKHGEAAVVPSYSEEVLFPSTNAIVKDIAGNNVLVYASSSSYCGGVDYYISAGNLVWDSHLWPVVVNVGKTTDEN